jgi:hypothetical protein
MDARIRDFQPSDGEAVVALSLRAWAPVFGSMEQVLGREIFVRLHGEDWREYQAPSVRGVLADDAMRVAMIGTGGDPGHAPARRVYEKADYTLIPMARYFKAL